MGGTTRTRNIQFMQERPRAVALRGEESIGLTGGERRIAKDPELIAWLAKVAVEIEPDPNNNGLEKRRWPWFSRRLLKRFLDELGVDMVQAKAADEDALRTMPSILRIPEKAIPALRGLRFLVRSPERTAMDLRQRFMAQARG